MKSLSINGAVGRFETAGRNLSAVTNNIKRDQFWLIHWALTTLNMLR